MVFLGLFARSWPAPISIIVTYGIYKFQGLLMETDEFKYDPRNPKVKSGERQVPHK
ncbi:hypothetical protein DFH27DRAFT_610737 [Peziza echinospora]|nr:hypothetical protein DFH27DRAFT_610737 [Peziza echinospora]